MSSLLAALSFFTFIPIPGKRITPQLTGWSLGLAPLTGLIVGAGLVGLDALIERVFSHPLRDGLVVLVWIVLTGATHIDGLADSLDALGAWASPERRLEILHDVNTGAFAVVGLSMLLIIKILSVEALPARNTWLLTTPVLARMALLPVMRLYPYARKEGLGAGLRQQLKIGPFVLALLTTGLTLWLAAQTAAWQDILLVSAIATLSALLFGWWAWRKLRVGLTGDIYGSTIEISELVVLLAAVAIA